MGRAAAARGEENPLLSPGNSWCNCGNAKLTFGRRVHCPFLRPFFLSPQDEERVRRVAETIAAVAERVTMAALEDNSLFQQFHLRPEEERLARMATGYGPASTASRLDAFLLPGFAEVHRVQRRVSRRSRLFGNHLGNIPAIAGDAANLQRSLRYTVTR